MKVIADLSLVPMGVGVSTSEYIAVCERELEKRGLEFRIHAWGTNVQGEWDDVLAAVKSCHEAVHGMGAPRIHTSLRIGTRTDRDESIDEKVRSVEERLGAR